jgi:hypothetical protein
MVRFTFPMMCADGSTGLFTKVLQPLIPGLLLRAPVRLPAGEIIETVAQPPEGTHPNAGAAAARNLPIPEGATREMLEDGERIYRGQVGGAGCTGCHGDNGQGTPLGPALTGKRWLLERRKLCRDQEDNHRRCAATEAIPQSHATDGWGATCAQRTICRRRPCLELEPSIFIQQSLTDSRDRST